MEVPSVIFGGSCRMNNPDELLDGKDPRCERVTAGGIGLSVRGDIPMRVIMQILRN
jgi:hypothetical protein